MNVYDLIFKAKFNPVFTESTNILYIYLFLSMRMKQSDWLIRLSQRAVFLHPARCEMQPDLCEKLQKVNKKCLLRNIYTTNKYGGVLQR